MRDDFEILTPLIRLTERITLRPRKFVHSPIENTRLPELAIKRITKNLVAFADCASRECVCSIPNFQLQFRRLG